MINTLRLYDELKETMDATAAKKIVEVMGQVYDELRNGVTKTEFNELKEIVRDLAEAQKRTETRMERLETVVAELAEAQKRTEERMGRLETAVEKLAEAQKRTEDAVQQLARQVGGLSDTVGGDIEDIAYIVLHDVLKREFGWQVGVLERTWVKLGDHAEEIDVFGRATDPARPGTTICIVGEAKHNLTVNEVRRFAEQVARARQHLHGEIFPVCFCYRARPEVQQMVAEAGIRLVFSYGKLV